MKKLITLLFLVISFVALSQERTVYLNNNTALDLNVAKWYAYNGTTADYLLPTTRDTIDFVLQVSNQGSAPLHFYAVITLAPIAGADTTVAITVQQKKFSGEAYSDVIASALTSAISTETLVVKTSLGVITPATTTIASATDYFIDETTTNTDTITVAARTITSLVNTLLYPRYMKFRLIIKGNDSVGTGIKVKRLEIQFY